MDADNAVAQATAAPPVEGSTRSSTGFKTFYREHYRTLMRQALYAGAEEDEAIEAAAATMAEMLPRWSQLTDPLFWGRKAVVTNFIKAKKRDQGRIHLQKRDFTASRAPLGDEAIEALIQQDWVDGLLGKLTAEQREVMKRLVEGHPPTEIAGMIGISPEAVRQRLMGARKRLKQLLKEEGDQAPRSGARSSGKETR